MFKIENYTETSKTKARSINLGNGNKIYFSYDTPIAFEEKQGNGSIRLRIRKNDFGSTTAAHLNAIARDKRKRVSSKVFTRQLTEFKKKFSYNPITKRNRKTEK